MSAKPPALTPDQIAALPTMNAADAIGMALTTFLGPWGAVAALAFKFGSPFVAKLIDNAHKNVDPTPDEWAKLDAIIDVPGEVLVPQRPTSTGPTLVTSSPAPVSTSPAAPGT